MRAVASILIVVLLASPIASSLGLKVRVDPPKPLPDLSDGDLMRLLAPVVGIEPRSPLPLLVPASATIPAVLMRLAARSGAPLAEADALDFAEVDARLAAPTLTLLLAVERSWDLYDQATIRLSPEEKIEYLTLGREFGPSNPRVLALGGEIDAQTLFESGLLLVDTIETIVIPQLQTAAALGIWPAEPIADPVGILRIGGTGNDVEALDRIVQIDARGDDTYLNNAGATTLLNVIFGDSDQVMYTPLAVSIDLSGDDTYRRQSDVPAQGGSDLSLGFGYMTDLAGNDNYYSLYSCQGGGFSIHRDHAGNDERRTGGSCAGRGIIMLFGILRDDEGDDTYNVGISSGGYSSIETAIGLLWDRSGMDDYLLPEPGLGQFRYGWGDEGGHGWLVDEGPEEDYYMAASSPAGAHGCNDCRWTIGQGPGAVLTGVRGFGNDNVGGLSAVLFEQEDLA